MDKFVISFLSAVALTAYAQAPTGFNADSKLSLRGFGPVQFGMTVKEASAAIGRPLVTIHLDGCLYVEPKGLASGGRIAPIRFVLDKNRRIASAEIFYGPWATDTGVRVGDPEQKFKDAYRGRLRDGKVVSSDPKERDFTMEVHSVDAAGRIQRIGVWRNDVDCG